MCSREDLLEIAAMTGNATGSACNLTNCQPADDQDPAVDIEDAVQEIALKELEFFAALTE
jgi:hypothetical protein